MLLAAAAMAGLSKRVTDTVRDRLWGEKTDAVGTGGVNTEFGRDGNDCNTRNDSSSSDGSNARTPEKQRKPWTRFKVSRHVFSNVCKACRVFDAVIVGSLAPANNTTQAFAELAALLGFGGALLRLFSACERAVTLHNARNEGDSDEKQNDEMMSTKKTKTKKTKKKWRPRHHNSHEHSEHWQC